ncbi:hypothetical protein OEA41_000021 [Lepraria neglecta]|uniref:Uncharacterized protein n=1 Tax=Lepraria neglecta TaxID=209136 RepID=A0AAD9ZFH1_9LECA|nr:hypothetical protein OEA41_000021 [Lepraria neglecta]
MNDKSANVDLAAKDPRALRSIAGGSLGGYTCPPELWEHARHVRKYLATKAAARRLSRPHNTASHEKYLAPATIGHNPRDHDGPYSTINPGRWLGGGFLLTSPYINRQITHSYDRRPNDSKTDAKPRKLEGQMLASGGPPPHDDNSEGPKREPEMLLQPETRPISHEQLVIAVKGIYAALVMVEAKCFDIDKRQSAAAQEKDPAKKIQLKNDQWQSLIALHK